MDFANVADERLDNKARRLFGRPLRGGKDNLALLAAHRWGALTFEQLAYFTGYSLSYASKTVIPALRKGGDRAYLLQIKPETDSFAGRPPLFFSLGKRGYDALRDVAWQSWGDSLEEDSDEAMTAALGRFVKPVERVFWGDGIQHKMDTVTALLAAEKSARAGDLPGGFQLTNLLCENRYWAGMRRPTALRVSDDVKLRADGVVEVSNDAGSSVAFLEIDRGTEPQTSAKADPPGSA
jgi:hypothetical protein